MLAWCGEITGGVLVEERFSPVGVIGNRPPGPALEPGVGLRIGASNKFPGAAAAGLGTTP